MNLCIDQGNSRTKIALFDERGEIKTSLVYRSFSSSDIERLFSLYSISDSIISSVANIEPAVVNVLHRHSQHFVLFDHTTPVPIRNGYETPQTLGQDRLAAAVGAMTLSPGENLLIIDAGSAITYDFVSSEGVFIGGNIAPGLKMRFVALHEMTKRLPLVEGDENELIPLFGRNTRDAIAAGVIRGVAYEARGYIESLSHQVDRYKTYVTGGSAQFICNHLREEVIYERNLVLIGLNCILLHNK